MFDIMKVKVQNYTELGSRNLIAENTPSETETNNILRAAKGLPVNVLPVWIMRQAGRYLPEFRKLREQYDFFTICQTPELAAEVTLMPVKRFHLDAAIIFSDILVIPQALGMTVEMKPGIGPVFPHPLIHPEDIDKLQSPVNVKKQLGYVFDAISLTRTKLKPMRIPLIGFSGAPWTLMAYMIEGGGSKTLSKAKAWLYKYPEDSHKLLKILLNVIVDYLVEQVVAGAQMLQIFESSAEYLGPELFSQYALPYITDIRKGVQGQLREKSVQEVPMVIFAKGAHYALEDLAVSGYDVISIDWTINPEEARRRVGPNVTLQGNLDPCALYAPVEELQRLVKTMVKKFGKERYIVNLGHGIYPDADPEKLKVLINYIHGL